MKTTTTLFTVCTRETILASSLSFLLISSTSFAGDGASATPWKNAEVTVATLDTGSVPDPCYNQFDAYTPTIFGAGVPFSLGTTSSATSLELINFSSLTCSTATVGTGDALDSTQGSYNTLTIDNSTFTAGSEFVAGGFGTDNAVNLTNAGKLLCSGLKIGAAATGDDNRINVQHAGSTVTVSGDIHVGYAGTRSSFWIAAGANVTGVNAIIGSNNTSDVSHLTVDGAGASLALTGNLTCGNLGTYANLDVALGGTLSCANLYTGAKSSGTNSGVEIFGTGATDTATKVTVTGNVHIGNDGAFSSLALSGGANLDCASFRIGYSQWTHDNSVEVIGTGATDTSTVLKATGSLYVGMSAARNDLYVHDGGDVSATSAYVGYFGGSDNNTLTISDAGSTFTASDTLDFGNGGSGNTLKVIKGASLGTKYIYIGSGSNGEVTLGRYNSVLVSGSGTTLAATSEIELGIYGLGNTLTLADSATLTTATLELGSASSANHNVLTVTGSGTSATVTNSTIGDEGSSNSLLVKDGATFTSHTLSSGSDNLADGNAIAVTGTGSQFLTDTLIIGNYGDDNTLHVGDGAYAYTRDSASVGAVKLTGGTCAGNGVTVRWPDAYWKCEHLMRIGTADNSDNFVSIENGAIVTVGYSNTTPLTIGAGSGNCVKLANGRLVLDGTTTADVTALISAGQIKVWNATTRAWVTATSDDVQRTIIPAGQSVWYTGIDGLSGECLVTGGDDFIPWGDATLLKEVSSLDESTVVTGGWYQSTWYGKFYAAPSHDGRWIWHSNHGWQYVVELDDSSIAVWDNGTQSWWYATQAWYPAMYNYGSQSWYYYMDGDYPNRRFWDYSTNAVATHGGK